MTDDPARFQTGTALDDVNDTFHAEYGETRSRSAIDEPVFVLLADTLTLVRRHHQHVEPITCRAFHVLKSAAHAPISLYATLQRCTPGSLPEEDRSHVTRGRDRCAAALTAMPPTLSPSAASVLTATVSEAEAALRGYDPEALDRFAAAMRPQLVAIAEESAAIQLAMLDDKVRVLLARLDEHERAVFEVVVAGDHQARVRSVGMQYFAKLCGEKPGAEARVAYGEGVTTVEAALELVGTRRLDRKIARAFFGDAKRLQQDVLGDAVASQLADKF